MDDFDPQVGPVSINGDASGVNPTALVPAIAAALVWAVAIYDVVVGVNYGAVINSAAFFAAYTQTVAIE